MGDIMSLPDGLLDEVNNYLDITWNDDAGDKKISGIISRGMKYLDGIAGKELNYIEEDKPKELLFEHCRYVRSGGLEDFQENFKAELLTLQISTQVQAYEEENTDV